MLRSKHVIESNRYSPWSSTLLGELLISTKKFIEMEPESKMLKLKVVSMKIQELNKVFAAN